MEHISKYEINWSKYFKIHPQQNEMVRRNFGAKKIYGMGLMPIRGPSGFRKMDYEFAEKKLNVKEILNKLEECHFNVLGLVIKDTDGACTWDTKVGWNPTNRDILGEFCDAAEDRNISMMVSFTSMNDAYQGHLHPERVSVHGTDGKHLGKEYKKGDISTHEEGEMRIDLPEGISIEEYRKKIPFLTNKIDEKIGKSRGARGKGYIPLTSFMCPNSKHVDYLLELAKEVVKNYPIRAFFADYIRYDGAFKNLCTCSRCLSAFKEQYGESAKVLSSEEWLNFREDTIIQYARKLHDSIKSENQNCLSGWFLLPGPKKLFTRGRIAQNWTKLSSILDVSCPMEYPYLTGTRDDSWFWGKVGDIAYWYFVRNMKKRAHEIKSPALSVVNSVECNTKEMLKQVKTFDFGIGIALFKYYGTTEIQWNALKKYAEEEFGLENLKMS